MVGQISQFDLSNGNTTPEYFVQIRFAIGETRSGLIEFYDSRNANQTVLESAPGATINVGTATPTHSFQAGGFQYYTFAVSSEVRSQLVSGNQQNNAVVFSQNGTAQSVLAFGQGNNSFTFVGGSSNVAGQNFSNLPPDIKEGGGINSNSQTFVVAPDGSVTTGGPPDPAAPCFLEGTLIATPAGEVAVESLRPGELVCLADGTVRPVRWIGRRVVESRFARHAWPVRIAAGALGDGLPRRDLLVSPDHAMFLDGALVHAAALVNGTTVRRADAMPPRFTYFHVELDGHALILAEGAATESFVDALSRRSFDNWADHPGEAPIADMDLPRVRAARQLPPATRARLAAALARLAAPAA